jgi:hypothetical protein
MRRRIEMITEPSVAKLLNDIKTVLRELDAMDVSQGVSIALAPLGSGDRVSVEISPQISIEVVLCLREQLNRALRGWQKVAGNCLSLEEVEKYTEN